MRGGEADEKRTLLRRAGLVFLLMVVLLAGLAAWEWLPPDNADAPQAVAPAVATAPGAREDGSDKAPVQDAVAAGHSAAVAPPAADTVAPAPAPAPAPVEPEAPATSAAAMEALAAKADEAARQAAGAQPAASGAAIVAPSPAAACPPPAPAPKPASRHGRSHPVPPQGKGYMLQLGVFGDPVNADSLREQLAAKGMPAYVESRVVLGPYKSEKEVEAAQKRLSLKHGMHSLVVPPRKPGK